MRTSLIYCLRFMSRLGMKRKEEEEEEEEEGEEEKEEEEGEEGERNGTHETTKNPLHVSAIDRRNFFFLFFFFFFLIFFRFSKFLFVPWRRNCETAEEKKINFPMKSTKSNDRHPAPNVRTRFKKKNKQTKKQTKGNGTVRLICFGQQRQRRKESKRRGGRRGENFYLQKKKRKKTKKKKRTPGRKDREWQLIKLIDWQVGGGGTATANKMAAARAHVNFRLFDAVVARSPWQRPGQSADGSPSRDPGRPPTHPLTHPHPPPGP